jgi:hypothetical protein
MLKAAELDVVQVSAIVTHRNGVKYFSREMAGVNIVSLLRGLHFT